MRIQEGEMEFSSLPLFLLRLNYFYTDMSKNIELEIRAEVLKDNFDVTFNNLKRQGNLISETNRLSVMFFGQYNNNCLDIRIRTTNGESEVVIKKGEIHSQDRTEYSQKISNNQFIDMVKLMSQFGFKSKVGERKTFNFQFPNKIVISLVRVGDLSYLEIEKMADELSLKKDKSDLCALAKNLDVGIIKNREKFDNFCKRLNETVDWEFLNTDACYKKLETLFKNQLKINKLIHRSIHYNALKQKSFQR